jgi:hypothetical protein
MNNYYRHTILKYLGAGLLVVLTGLVLISVFQSHSPSKPVIFTDVSWPNCNKTVALDNTEWGIVGVSGGLDYRLNPCLKTEVSWFSHYGLYINTGYPGITAARKYSIGPNLCAADDRLCIAYDYGYQATVYDIHYAIKLGLVTPLWSLDVETANAWSNNPLNNSASLQGVINAIKQLTFKPTIVIYSTLNQWAAVTNNWRPATNSWLGTGDTSLVMAVNACQEPSFTNGLLRLTQYTPFLDQDYVCQPLPLWAIGP